MTADAVLLIAFGGPTRPEEIEPFLANVVRVLLMGVGLVYFGPTWLSTSSCGSLPFSFHPAWKSRTAFWVAAS